QLTATLEVLESGDERLRGTALEYLDTLLASRGREALLQFIERYARRRAEPAPSSELDSLRRSHETIRISLSEIRGRPRSFPSDPPDHPDQS
ncbi:MAG TPA: hypothetical protein VFR10_07960, partial [bacterium]|nr:hypothetical protein [bacterium]